MIEAIKDLEIPEFSGDGEYLIHYTDEELRKSLGERHDDAANTFTARVLLLLESRPLLGECVYRTAVENVIAAYWRDYQDHKKEFIPAFLANDILRLWRTFCVNYEARTSTEPEEKKVKRRLKNYKLKHSRLLTCYSALLYLLATYKMKKTVSPEDAVSMTEMTPTQRLEWLLKCKGASGARDQIRALLRHYEAFLQSTYCSEEQLIKHFRDPGKRKEYSASANKLGDLTFRTLSVIGKGNALHRILVV